MGLLAMQVICALPMVFSLRSSRIGYKATRIFSFAQVKSIATSIHRSPFPTSSESIHFKSASTSTRKFSFSPKVESEDSGPRNKRKVAIVLCYVGSNYNGLQYNTNGASESVEVVLERALSEIGCICESNQRNLKKIGWSRSSRTDKGVHAARVIVAAKLEMKSNWSPTKSGGTERYISLVEKLNTKLPPDIRALSCIKINNGFVARSACNWREYEYVFPAQMLLDSCDVGPSDTKSTDIDAAVIKMNEVLARMEGTNSFHNFHRLSSKTVLSPKFKKKSNREGSSSSANVSSLDDQLTSSGELANSSTGLVGDFGDEAESNEEDDDDDDEDDDDEDDEDKNIEDEEIVDEGMPRQQDEFAGQTIKHNTSAFENWTPTLRTIANKTQCTIYRCRARRVADQHSSTELIQVVIRGQSFLLHQIRLMVGSAIMATRGLLPSYIADLAILAPHHIILPMAPANGLLLADTGFARQRRNLSMALTPPQLSSQFQSAMKSKEVELCFMTEKDYNTSEEFKRKFIYPTIMKGWTENNNLMMNTWLSECAERFQVPESTRLQWEAMLQPLRDDHQQFNDDKFMLESRRIEYNIQLFKSYEEEEATAVVARAEEGGKATTPTESTHGVVRQKRKKVRIFNHRIFLPNGMSTELIVRFNLIPAEHISHALRILAFMMIRGHLAADDSPQAIVDKIISMGGYKRLLLQRVHRSIE